MNKRYLLLLERSLVASGLACLALWAGARLHARTTQARAAREFAQAPARTRPAPSTAPSSRPSPAPPAPACPSGATPESCAAGMPAPAADLPAPDMSLWDPARRALHARAWSKIDPDAALGRLDIPSLHLAVAVLPGTDAVSLNGGVGHIAGTPLPGEGGNVGIAGHRDGFFRGLERVKAGDALKLSTQRGTFEYRVEWIRIVEPRDVEVLGDAGCDAVTLVTCYPFRIVGSAPKRYIVRATCVGAVPPAPEPSAPSP